MVSLSTLDVKHGNDPVTILAARNKVHARRILVHAHRARLDLTEKSAAPAHGHAKMEQLSLCPRRRVRAVTPDEPDNASRQAHQHAQEPEFERCQQRRGPVDAKQSKERDERDLANSPSRHGNRQRHEQRHERHDRYHGARPDRDCEAVRDAVAGERARYG